MSDLKPIRCTGLEGGIKTFREFILQGREKGLLQQCCSIFGAKLCEVGEAPRARPLSLELNDKECLKAVGHAVLQVYIDREEWGAKAWKHGFFAAGKRAEFEGVVLPCSKSHYEWVNLGGRI